jgi:branched-chain amino acid transport system substrate-binding protein
MRFSKIIALTVLTHLLVIPCFKDVSAQDGVGSIREKVKIGLLIPDEKSVSAKYGAQLAIDIANRQGRINGNHFQLEVRSMEGPWGTGSKQAVDLIFDEKVVALLGSHDGRNAHLVEQAATKARVVLISAWASDPTLSKAFVPWFFNCVPNDLQQAASLLKEIYDAKKYDKIGIISCSDYDSKLALQSFLKKIREKGKPDPLSLLYDLSGLDYKEITDKILKADLDCIILLGKPSISLSIINLIHLQKAYIPFYCPLSVIGETELSDVNMKEFEGVVFVSPGDWFLSVQKPFCFEYKKAYNENPNAEAAFAFDGMNLIIEAIGKAGTDREMIQKYLTKIHFPGATGTIGFDDKGNRKGDTGLIEIKNGIPALVKK